MTPIRCYTQQGAPAPRGPTPTRSKDFHLPKDGRAGFDRLGDEAYGWAPLSIPTPANDNNAQEDAA